MKECICRELERLGKEMKFTTDFEFTKFENKLHSFVINKQLEEIKFHKNKYWERIFKCTGCGKLWILIEPDYPFQGHWKLHEE